MDLKKKKNDSKSIPILLRVIRNLLLPTQTPYGEAQEVREQKNDHFQKTNDSFLKTKNNTKYPHNYLCNNVVLLYSDSNDFKLSLVPYIG